MEPSECQGRSSKKIMRLVMVDHQLLIVNIHVIQDETVKNLTEAWNERNENSSQKICEWFNEDQFLEIMKGLKPILLSRINSPLSSNLKQNYQSKELKSIKNVAVSYIFKKRPRIPGQQFVVRKSDSVYCSCGKKLTQDNEKWKSFPIFQETLEITVMRSISVGPGNNQSESIPYHKPVEEGKESKLKDDGTSSYFTQRPDCLQTSSVKRKKTILRKMAKKSRIALNALPSYQSFNESYVEPQEQREEDMETIPKKASNSRDRCRPDNKDTKTTSTTVIDLEKVPEGLKDVSKVEELREDHLKFLISQMEDYLRTIFRGEVYCRRHEEYKKGGKSRDDLNFQVGMAHFSEEQHECILFSLVAMFCYKDKKYLDYVTKVMLPEALIKLYQDVHKTSFEEAEECLFNDTIHDN